jgi:hypothetical protein
MVYVADHADNDSSSIGFAEERIMDIFPFCPVVQFIKERVYPYLFRK